MFRLQVCITLHAPRLKADQFVGTIDTRYGTYNIVGRDQIYYNTIVLKSSYSQSPNYLAFLPRDAQT